MKSVLLAMIGLAAASSASAQFRYWSAPQYVPQYAGATPMYTQNYNPPVVYYQQPVQRHWYPPQQPQYSMPAAPQYVPQNAGATAMYIGPQFQQTYQIRYYYRQ